MPPPQALAARGQGAAGPVRFVRSVGVCEHVHRITAPTILILSDAQPPHTTDDTDVPWQRVINASSTISPRGDGGLSARRQAERLREEGVQVTQVRTVRCAYLVLLLVDVCTMRHRFFRRLCVCLHTIAVLIDYVQDAMGSWRVPTSAWWDAGGAHTLEQVLSKRRRREDGAGEKEKSSKKRRRREREVGAGVAAADDDVVVEEEEDN